MGTAAHPNRIGLAAMAMMIAVLSLSLGDAIIKAAGLSLPLWQMFILRSALTVPPLLFLVVRSGRSSVGSLFWAAVRSSLLVAMWLSYYSALPLMPLSAAAAAYYTSPIIISVLSAVLSRRWPTLRGLVAIFLGFAGVVLILRPDTSGFELATLLPVLAALLYACAMVLTSQKCWDDDPFTLALMLNLAFIIAGIGLGAFAGQEGSLIFGPWQSLDPALISIVVGLAVVVLAGSVGTAIAYQNGPPETVAVFDYSYLVFSLIWGILFFGEVPNLLALTGFVAIVGAGFLALPKSIDL